MTTEIHLIGGCGSSGTTLLAWLLDGLGDLRSGPESGLFHHGELYRSEDFTRCLGRHFDHEAHTRSVVINRLRIPLIPKIFFMHREFFGLAEPRQESWMRTQTDNFEALLEYVFRSFADTAKLEEDFAWIDQTPKNCLTSTEFLAWRPEGRFIHLLRDGRDVLLSLARRWAKEAPGHPPSTYLGAAAARWTYDTVQAQRAAEQPGFLEIRYEDLVQSPLRTLNRVLRHLGREAIDESALSAHQSPSALLAGTSFFGGPKPTWSAQPGTEIRTDGVGRWRKQLQPHVLQQLRPLNFRVPGDSLTYHFGEQLKACGYD